MLPITDYSRKYIVTNFAYGTGPFLRTTNLAIAFNREYEKLTGQRMGIIIPWLYGDRQKRVMLEEFSDHEMKYPGEIVLDNQLGALYQKVFYGSHAYEDAVKLWVDQALMVSREAFHYLKGTLSVETLSGIRQAIKGKDIAVELSRSPRIQYGVAPAYFTSFASLEEILERASTIPGFVLSKKVLTQAVHTAHEIEQGYRMYALSYPGTFTYDAKRKSHFENEIEVPPIAPPPQAHTKKMDSGIFVTVTGIPGLERLYREAHDIGLRLYSNDTTAVPHSVRALPHIIPNKNITFQFARSGWSSVWISMISGTPLVVPEYDPTDDPEICFNNICVERLGIALVYRGESLASILKKTGAIKRACQKLVTDIMSRFGTLDGNMYCATMFARDFVARITTSK